VRTLGAKSWGLILCFLSLLLGTAALLQAGFGMPPWFFVVTQVWFWTLGLPTLLAVVLVASFWGTPGWPAGWAFIPVAIVAAIAAQTAAALAARNAWQYLKRSKQ
jgi:hypothetical protein